MTFKNYPKCLRQAFLALSLCALAACSHPPSISSSDAPAVTNDQTMINKAPKAAGAPPMTILKAGKTLQMVRVMEGGACKNLQQGAKGAFLLYADADDIKRIKTRQGSEVFAEFEKTITDFSVLALQVTVNKINFDTDTPHTDPSVAQQKLMQQFNSLFQEAIAASIVDFQIKSTLKIAVQPFVSELVFYKKGCEATKDAEENQQEKTGQGI
ncbi:MAG: hypothetical protein HOP02_10010 [Methylococcaceae bacterium]|nr:hypothetical protein [Methylococcaceae bacterium]